MLLKRHRPIAFTEQGQGTEQVEWLLLPSSLLRAVQLACVLLASYRVSSVFETQSNETVIN